MASLRNTKKIVLVVVGVFVLLGVAQYINWFVYPFSSAKPNFADVEAVYSKMQIPNTWKKTSEGANKGIAGRQCGIESDGCFSKWQEFLLMSETGKDDIKKVILESGCVSVVEDDKSQTGDKREVYLYECMYGGVRIVGSWEKLDTKIVGRLTTKSR